MSRRSSRLHTLERGLKAPRRPRTHARALTVMRLEGSATGAQSSTRPARLPRDMEDQIAVVRGRAVGKPSRGLLQLEERLLNTHDAERAAPAIQRHEHGAMAASAMRTPRALAASLAGSAFGGRYDVESFEDKPSSIPGVPVARPVTGYHAGTASATMTPVKTDLYSTPPASKPRARQHALTQDQQAVAANFERDVAAMLGKTSAVNAPEDRQWDDTLRNAAQAPATAGTSAVEAPASPAAPRREAHDVFNQMGLAMSFANNFDLGAMDLSARFDRFDNELALAPAAAPTTPGPVPVQALSLDDFDLVADLAEISGARSATPTAAAPASEQPVTKQDAPTATPT